MRLGDPFPDFAADTSQGPIESFHAWMGEQIWAILFSHPADFTPVCTTELARAAQLATEFARRGVKLAALSCDSVETHRQWLVDIVAYGNGKKAEEAEQKQKQKGEIAETTAGKLLLDVANFPFPIIGDEHRELASRLGMLDPLNLDASGVPFTVRAVFIIDPQKRLRLSILYPASTGRNFDEILRVVDSMQLSDKHMLATPEGWIPGTQCMVEPRVSDEQAKQLFGGDDGNAGGVHTMQLPSGRPYLRMVAQPKPSSLDDDEKKK